ncbi:MAG: hypothetical protein D6772_10800 [Bacteroidetes bacterium]|nr:MAG: hypothetical protein D6772_10800 [Bacteroidota bacterium]
MALQPINTLRTWFSRFKKPTQQQFWDVFDSFWHKNELIPIAGVDGLEDALTNAGGGGSVTDGDKGDIIVSSGGTVWQLDTAVVEAAQLAPQAVTPDALQLVPGLTAATYEDATVQVDTKGRVVAIQGVQVITLVAYNGINNEGSMTVRYKGVAPTLTWSADGVYSLNAPSGCRLLSYRWLSNEHSSFQGDGSVQLSIVCADGTKCFDLHEIRQQIDGRKLGSINSISDLQTEPAAGTVRTKWTNLTGASGGYIINAKIVSYE